MLSLTVGYFQSLAGQVQIWSRSELVNAHVHRDPRPSECWQHMQAATQTRTAELLN